MKRMVRSSATILTLVLVAGCGIHAVGPVAPVQGAVADQAVARDAQVRALITRAQALRGYSAPVQAERVHLYGQLGRTDNDKAADFLLAELGRWETWNATTQQALEPALLSALKQLAADDKLGSTEAMPPEDGSTVEAGKGKGKHTRKFNIWTGIYKFFGVKRKHGGGGGHKPPAPKDAAPGGDAGGDAGGGAPAPAPDPAAGAPTGPGAPAAPPAAPPAG